MIWYDYARHWKKHQNEFTQLEVKRTEERDPGGAGQGRRRRSARPSRSRSPAAQEEKKARAQRDREGRGRARQARRRVVPRRPGLPLHQGQDRRRPLRVRGGRTTRAPGARTKKKKHLDELEKQWGELRLKLEDVIARAAPPAPAAPSWRRRSLEADKTEKEIYAEKIRLDEKLKKIRPGFVSFVRNMPVLDLANPSLKVNQIMPANLTDDVIFTRHAEGGPLHDLPPRHRQEGVRERAPAVHHAPQARAVPAGPAPHRAHRLHRLPPGPRPRHQLRGRGAHARPPPEQEKAWGKYTRQRHVPPPPPLGPAR